ncbi:hypothetical protein ABZ769_27030 [Streptomyces olivoreticuli]
MPFLFHRWTGRMVALCAAAAAATLLALGAFCVYRGTQTGDPPDSGWGAWEVERVADWSASVRVNAQVHAAEAEVHMGKAESITIKAYG